MHVELSKAIDEAFAQTTLALGDRRNDEALLWLERAYPHPAPSVAACAFALVDAAGWLATEGYARGVRSDSEERCSPAVLAYLGAHR